MRPDPTGNPLRDGVALAKRTRHVQQRKPVFIRDEGLFEKSAVDGFPILSQDVTALAGQTKAAEDRRLLRVS
jgi:hypothetical protein